MFRFPRGLGTVRRSDIEKYCIENDLSIEKVYSSGRSEGFDRMIVTYFDEDDESYITYKDGRRIISMGGPPAPSMLEVYLEEDGSLRFVQTEHTHRLREHESAMA